jgi:hypothetical protein
MFQNYILKNNHDNCLKKLQYTLLTEVREIIRKPSDLATFDEVIYAKNTSSSRGGSSLPYIDQQQQQQAHPQQQQHQQPRFVDHHQQQQQQQQVSLKFISKVTRELGDCCWVVVRGRSLGRSAVQTRRCRNSGVTEFKKINYSSPWQQSFQLPRQQKKTITCCYCYYCYCSHHPHCCC